MPPVFMTDHRAALVLYAAYIIWLVPEFIHTFTHRVAAKARTDDHRSGLAIGFALWGGVYAAYWLAHVEPGDFIDWHPYVLFGLGIALMVAGVTFRWYAVHVLGKYFSMQLAIQPGQTVVETGPYHLIRHPSYSGALLTMFGLGLAFTNWLSLLGIMLAGFIGYSYRVMVEERTLVTALGGPYREYMQRTKRFIPFIY